MYLNLIRNDAGNYLKSADLAYIISALGYLQYVIK